MNHAVINGFEWLGGGPLRLRRLLRKRQRNLGALLTAPKVWDGLKTTLPFRSAGADLRSLLGDLTRFRLETAVTPTQERRVRQSAWAETGPASGSTSSGRGKPAQWETSPSTSLASEPVRSGMAKSTVRPEEARQVPALVRQVETYWKHTVRANASTPHPGSLSLSVGTQSAPFTPIGKKGVSQEAPAGGGKEPKNLVVQADSSRAVFSPIPGPPGFSVIAESAPATNSRGEPWPRWTAKELVDSIERIREAPPEAVSSETAVHVSNREGVEIRNVFHIQMKAAEKDLDASDVLADQVAEILRNQALQHGIDIT